MNIVIVGDSFSSDNCNGSWINLLEKNHTVTNLSQRGISQYRIYTIIKQNLLLINQSDVLLVWHTNSDRIYIPDGVDYPTRLISSHSCCDMIANDALNNSDWKKIAHTYYKNFYDKDMQEDISRLLIDKIHQVVRSKILDFSGFDIFHDYHFIKSFHNVRLEFPGNINHLNLVGNSRVFEYINQGVKPCES
jgi:hypothetical protein